MADTIGAAAAMAPAARGKLRPGEAGGGGGAAMNAAFASYVAEGLTLPMRETLRRRQADMFGPSVVTGAGVTLKALRRRGVVEGKLVPRVTELGELVIAAAGLDQPAGEEPAGITNSDTPAVAPADVSVTSPVGPLSSGPFNHLKSGA